MKHFLSKRKHNFVFIAISLVLCASLAAFTSCLSSYYTVSSCSLANNEMIVEKYSPDDRMKAVVFFRDAGATTSSSYQLSVLNSNEEFPDSSGNVFISYSDILIEWQDNSTLLVFILEDKPIFKQEAMVDSIAIKYFLSP